MGSHHCHICGIVSFWSDIAASSYCVNTKWGKTGSTANVYPLLHKAGVIESADPEGTPANSKKS